MKGPDTPIPAHANSDKDNQSPVDWNAEPIEHLMEHLIATHHQWTERAVPALDRALEQAVQEGTAESAALLNQMFARLNAKLDEHCRMEEKVLFPAIQAMERHRQQGKSPPKAIFGSIRNPITMMERDHDEEAQQWVALRNLASAQIEAKGASEFTRQLCRELIAFEEAVRSHSDLENSILFPRAMQLERG